MHACTRGELLRPISVLARSSAVNREQSLSLAAASSGASGYRHRCFRRPTLHSPHPPQGVRRGEHAVQAVRCPPCSWEVHPREGSQSARSVFCRSNCRRRSDCCVRPRLFLQPPHEVTFVGRVSPSRLNGASDAGLCHCDVEGDKVVPLPRIEVPSSALAPLASALPRSSATPTTSGM